MKCTILSVLGLLIVATSIFAQISPTPVINNEIRDGSSIRRRSMELERVKREAAQTFPQESNEEATIRFAKVKDDYEHIQKLQAEIIKTYTTGKEINYSKISSSADEMNRKSIRLEANLFNIKAVTNKNGDKKKSLSVRDLIIELDKVLGNFVDSPIFKSNKLIEQNDVEESQTQLEKIIKLSETLSQEAKKFK